MAGLTVKNIRPLAGYVVVEPQEAASQTTSGIYLPTGSEEKPQVGTVVAISESMITEDGAKIVCPVKVGEAVLYKKWGGNEVKADGKEIQILKYEDLIAVVK
jgi:chaperonin GroES